MNIPRFLKKLYPKLAKTVSQNIKNQIRGGLFSHSPYGSPLNPLTILRRQNKHHNALEDTGRFMRGVRYKTDSRGATIYSEGKTVKQQEGFILGMAKGVPERNPFVSDLPVARSNQDIQARVTTIAGIEIKRYVDGQISKLKGVT